MQASLAMEQVPLVSVGMPVYNSAEYIRAICDGYAARDSRVRYVRNARNLGASENYNNTFRLARGRFFKWASSNDTCHPDFLQSCVDILMRDSSVVLACPRTRAIYDAGSTEDLHDNLDLLQPDSCVRFRLLLERMRLNNLVNGVIRADVLRRTPLVKPFLASDVGLIAEIALHGKVAEVPQFMFYRRVDAATATARKTDDAVAAHYNPSSRRAPLFSVWRLYAYLFAAVRRAPVSLKSKLCLCRYVARRLLWYRKDLISEVRDAMSRAMGLDRASHARQRTICQPVHKHK